MSNDVDTAVSQPTDDTEHTETSNTVETTHTYRVMDTELIVKQSNPGDTRSEIAKKYDALEQAGITLPELRRILKYKNGIFIPYFKDEVKQLYPWARGHTQVTIELYDLPQSGDYGACIRMVEIHLKESGPIYLKASVENTSIAGDKGNKVILGFEKLNSEVYAINAPTISKYDERDLAAIVYVTGMYSNNSQSYRPEVVLNQNARSNSNSLSYFLGNGISSNTWKIVIDTVEEIEKIHVIPGTNDRLSKTGKIRVKYDEEIIMDKEAWNITNLPYSHNNKAELNVNEFIIEVDKPATSTTVNIDTTI